MTEAMVLIFVSILKGTIAVVAEQMRLAGATEAQINDAVIKARHELDGMHPSTLPKQKEK